MAAEHGRPAERRACRSSPDRHFTSSTGMEPAVVQCAAVLWWDPAPLVNDLRDHKYAIVILDAELYPEPVLVAIGQFYFQDRTVHLNGATYHVFLPGTQ